MTGGNRIKKRTWAGLLAGAVLAAAITSSAVAQAPVAQDAGLYVHYCPSARGASAARYTPRAHAAETSHAGWPQDQCLKMDKGPAGHTHTLVGVAGVHNWLLGGYGNDTLIGGDQGDVMWGDYHPTAKPAFQTAYIRGGNGRNFIYANDTVNYVWTGTNAQTVVHAYLPGTRGVIYCQSPGVVVYLSHRSQPHFHLHGCRHISHFSVGH